jgi:UDP:flavonoid glycosyltransferase YjiC (YdhE family)
MSDKEKEEKMSKILFTNFTEGNVHFYRFVPAEEVLKQCDLAIHHGGQNTTVQAIERQAPAIIYPGLHFERHFNARKAEEVGCARLKRNNAPNHREPHNIVSPLNFT